MQGKWSVGHVGMRFMKRYDRRKYKRLQIKLPPICHFQRPVSWPRHRCGEQAVREWRNDLKSFLQCIMEL